MLTRDAKMCDFVREVQMGDCTMGDDLFVLTREDKICNLTRADLVCDLSM